MILGVTLARGGSKGLLFKNLANLNGKPLLVWTIEAAQKSKLIDRYIVSTENCGVRKVAEKHGAEVVDRPTELALDYITRFEVLRHIVKMEPCSAVVLLQCTSPIRFTGMIDSCIREFKECGYDLLVTGFIGKDEPFGRNFSKHRQEKIGEFCDDGNIYIWNAELIRAGIEYPEDQTRIGRKVLRKPENVDINDDIDLYLAGKLMESPWMER